MLVEKRHNFRLRRHRSARILPKGHLHEFLERIMNAGTERLLRTPDDRHAEDMSVFVLKRAVLESGDLGEGELLRDMLLHRLTFLPLARDRGQLIFTRRLPR